MLVTRDLCPVSLAKRAMAVANCPLMSKVNLLPRVKRKDEC